MLSFFNQSKHHSLSIEGQTEILTTHNQETLLNSALRQKVRLPYSCKVGGCASCKCQLISGQVKELTESAYILSAEDLDNNMILACQSIAKSDITIKLANINSQAPKPLQSAAKVVARRQLTADIIELEIESYQPINYLAGQYALITVPGVIEEPRSYSFADAPTNSCRLRFYIRQVEGGQMSSWAHSEQALNTEVTIDGPYGDFHLPTADLAPSSAPIICLAAGSGLAPIKSLLENALLTHQQRP